MKQELLKVIGQDRLKAFYNDTMDVRDSFTLIEEMLDALEINEDDVEQVELTQHEQDCEQYDNTRG